MKFFATAARGTEGALRDELRALGLPGVKGDRGGAHFEGDLSHGARACLESSIAVRVLVELARFDAPDETSLYDGVRSVDWTGWLSPRHTLSVSATCRSSGLTHSHFIALRAKDAMVDQLRDRYGSRPDVDPRDPDVSVVLRLVKDECTLYVDLAGEPLHRRGYRRLVVEAVMKETLAAAVLRLSGWSPDTVLLDPLCGAGTIAIEAARMARKIAPGRDRRFGFERWPSFDAEARKGWAEMRAAAKARELPAGEVTVFASDRERTAVETTERNARDAGVLDSMRIERVDAREVRPPAETGWVVTDPPYGDRNAAQPLQLGGFLRQFGEHLAEMHGWSVVVLAGSVVIPRSIPLRAEWEHTVFNGDIECRLFRYRVK